jgi:hypothetical protein
MVLGGAMFSFDKLNSLIGGGKPTAPVVADIMPSRWAYEALAVTQFKDNRYEKKFYDIEKIESQANFKQVYYISELERILKECNSLSVNKDDSSRILLKENLTVLKNEISSESKKWEDIPSPDPEVFTEDKFNEESSSAASAFLDQVKTKYSKLFNIINSRKNELIVQMEREMGNKGYSDFYRDNYNDFLATLVKKSSNQEKLYQNDSRLIQISDPVFKDPEGNHIASLRALFYTPYKYLFNYKVNTLWFNLGVIWLFTVILYVILYYNVVLKILNLFNRY